MSDSVTLTFPLTRVKQFRHDPFSGQRYGQGFFDFMKLDKCVQDRDFCSKLYNADDDEARKMIAERTDHNS